MSIKVGALGLAFAAVLILGCASGGAPSPPPPAGSNATPTPTPVPAGKIPLSDLGTGTYLGFQGGLYANGSNTVPSAQDAAGLARAALVQPLDINGAPSASGKIVLMSIGMSNTNDEWCGIANHGGACFAWTFMGQAATDASVNHTTLVIADGARGGQDAKLWLSPTACLPAPVDGYCNNYDRVAALVLAPVGVSEKQVQVIWLKEADAGPSVSLPSSAADAYTLEGNLGKILRASKVRYPNLQMVFLSSRIYAGYATTTLNPEPYAYESGFADKWLIQAQINQMATSTVDPIAGDLNFTSGVAPWTAWAAYLWANGATPRSDGLVWLPGDFQSDGTHPAQSGQTKVGTMLMTFFKQSSYTQAWFL